MLFLGHLDEFGSFGSRETEFSVCETRDFKHVVDWVAAQAWSNGRVAALGVSYSGNTAEHATFDPSPALHAVIPRFTDFDGYASILYPGGLRNKLITDNWGDAVHALDNNLIPEGRAGGDGNGPVLLGVKPVDSDLDGSLLKEAVKQHASNLKLTDFFAEISFRDEINFADAIPANGAAADCSALVSPYRFREAVEANLVPAFHWGSWQDAGTAAGVLARFSSYSSPARYIIGPWSHGASHDTGVFNDKDQPVDMSVEEQYGSILEFLAPFMTGEEGEKLEGSTLTYFTMGEDQWKTTSTWPPEGQVESSWYLAADHTLAGQTPDESGEDAYTVDFEAGTGSSTRWTTQLGGGDVYYGDRAEADPQLLIYTSTPLAAAIEITGHPRVELYVSSTETDGALLAYLETVSPEGKVSMITEGGLRLIHRKTLPIDQAPYPAFGPYHSFASGDSEPMVPGEPSLVEFAMWPTSVVIPAGYSLRLAIAGHDKDTFARYPATGNPILTLHRNQVQPSRLVIPIIRSQ